MYTFGITNDNFRTNMYQQVLYKKLGGFKAKGNITHAIIIIIFLYKIIMNKKLAGWNMWTSWQIGYSWKKTGNFYEIMWMGKFFHLWENSLRDSNKNKIFLSIFTKRKMHAWLCWITGTLPNTFWILNVSSVLFLKPEYPAAGETMHK